MSRKTARKYAFELIFQIPYYEELNLNQAYDYKLSEFSNISENVKNRILDYIKISEDIKSKILNFLNISDKEISKIVKFYTSKNDKEEQLVEILNEDDEVESFFLAEFKNLKEREQKIILDFLYLNDKEREVFLEFVKMDKEREEKVLEFIKMSDDDKKFIFIEFKGVSQNLELIDAYIERNLKNWKIERIEKEILALARLSIYEMLFDETIPISISINEAVELAKEYSDDKGRKFLNGLLSTVSTEIESQK